MCVPNPVLRFPQKYTEDVLSALDPSQPPLPPLQHFLEQPVERVQQYQALLKVQAAAWPPSLALVGGRADGQAVGLGPDAFSPRS